MIVRAPMSRLAHDTISLLVILAIGLFLAAFLLFLVQPMIAKVLLPWFGGSAAVWTVCLLFFQVLLLLGYQLGFFTQKL